MFNNLFTRMLALLLCLCLLPAAAFADSYQDVIAQSNDGTPVTRSDFEMSFRFYADGFEDDGMMHYSAWEELFNKITLRGVVDAQSFPTTDDRVYFNGGVYLNNKLTVPFEYDAYGNLRFISSPALNGDSLFFHMSNFLEFMLKPYRYISLPTQYAALLLYPEAWVKMWDMYSAPFETALASAQNNVVSYDDLYEMCDDLNLIALEDEDNRVYFFATSLMIDLGMTWTALEKLGCWEGLLDHLDPEKQGMTITRRGENEKWVLGQTTVYEKTVANGETEMRIFLPDPDGYEFSIEWVKGAEECTFELLILLDGEEYYHLSAGADGLPAEGDLSANGMIWADITGDALYQDIAPIRLQYAYERTAQAKPYDMTFSLDVLGAETQRPILGVSVSAAVEEVSADVLHTVECTEDTDWDDFFSLNEMLLKEHIARFKRTVVLAAAPFALEVPAGVISDVVAYMEETGLLGLFGIE